MTLEEARKVAAILAQADGGCSGCVRDLVKQAQDSFPEFVWVTDHDRPDVRGREDWAAITAAWEAQWPADLDADGQPCPVRVRPVRVRMRSP